MWKCFLFFGYHVLFSMMVGCHSVEKDMVGNMYDFILFFTCIWILFMHAYMPCLVWAFFCLDLIWQFVDSRVGAFYRMSGSEAARFVRRRRCMSWCWTELVCFVLLRFDTVNGCQCSLSQSPLRLLTAYMKSPLHWFLFVVGPFWLTCRVSKSTGNLCVLPGWGCMAMEVRLERKRLGAEAKKKEKEKCTRARAGAWWQSYCSTDPASCRAWVGSSSVWYVRSVGARFLFWREEKHTHTHTHTLCIILLYKCVCVIYVRSFSWLRREIMKIQTAICF